MSPNRWCQELDLVNSVFIQFFSYISSNVQWYTQGENGDALDLSGLDKDSIEAVVAEYGYNNLASDIISLDRQIKDFRPKE